MIVGAVTRSFEKGQDRYLKLIPERLLRIQEIYQ